MPFALTFLGFPHFYYFLSALSASGCLVSGQVEVLCSWDLPHLPGSGGWPLAPISQAAPRAGRQSGGIPAGCGFDR